MGSFALQLAGPRRDPWWDPHGRRRRHRTRRRLLGLSAIALLLAALSLGLRAAPTRAAASVNLDQWASLDLAWQNGNLNGNNARYPEGGIVPFRLALEGLTAGSHEIHINYDFTAGGHKAYDFLATWNVTNANGAICAPSGGAISTMCPSLGAASTFSFPPDPYSADGLSVTTAQVYSGAPRKLTLWGGTITSISGPVHSGSPDGNSTADFVVRFTTGTGPALLAWGGHLAQSAFWNTVAGGERDGAGEVSGAPWHMRTLKLDGTGNKNQDRSIQPSAIVGELPPFALTPSPQPTAAQPSGAPGRRPTPAPGSGGSGGGSGTPTSPGSGAGGGGLPRITPPPTATESIPETPARGPAGVAVALLLSVVALLGTSRAVERRRARTRRALAAPNRS